jgi:amino acid permease
MYFSAYLYLETKKRLMCESSFTAVAKKCIGDVSSLLVNSLIAFCIWGVLSLFAILFAQISLALFGPLSKTGSIWDTKSTYVVILCLLQVPQVFRKSMHEIKIATYLLFTSLICMLVIMQIKIYNEGTYTSRNQDGITIHKSVTLESYVDSLNISVASFGFVLTLFPVYTSMKKAKRN